MTTSGAIRAACAIWSSILRRKGCKVYKIESRSTMLNPRCGFRFYYCI
jgi:hypothetical protein